MEVARGRWGRNEGGHGVMGVGEVPSPEVETDWLIASIVRVLPLCAFGVSGTRHFAGWYFRVTTSWERLHHRLLPTAEPRVLVST